MRVLTCFLPPTAGTANVAGFDVIEQPMEVKKRIGYLPETPPLYPEMEVSEYLVFTGRLKGISSADIGRRVDEVMGRCAIGDVRNKLIGKLSKGYRQRVGLAQAIIHNPDVLILDEPTSGLDPKQIIEIRELLKALAGEHTIILSTHILSEVEHSCERVIIINRGKLVAIDSVANLTNRLRGSEAVALEVQANGGSPAPAEVQQRLEQVPGVSRVVMKDPRDSRLQFEIESLQGRQIRADLARTVVSSGWALTEMRAVGLSLEDIFLQLTAAEQKDQKEAAEGRGGRQVTNILLICKKELKSYFASPIAYLLMAFFGLIFGFGFYTATRDMVRYSFMAQMQGQPAQMNVNQQIIIPLLGFASTVGSVPDPHDHHAHVRGGKEPRHHRAAAHLAGDGHGNHPGQVAPAPCCSTCACWGCRCSTWRCCLCGASRT